MLYRVTYEHDAGDVREYGTAPDYGAALALSARLTRTLATAGTQRQRESIRVQLDRGTPRHTTLGVTR